MGSLSNILCPISKEFKVTEVKARKKDGTYNARWGRFVEVYNTGIDFTLDDIAISGLVSMDLDDGPATTVSQGQYVVFYDANDAPFGNSDVLSTPTCHLCEDPCDLTGCVSTDDTYTGVCWCQNSVYVACVNSGETSPSLADGCDDNVDEHSGVDACSVCTFNDAMVWNIYIYLYIYAYSHT